MEKKRISFVGNITKYPVKFVKVLHKYYNILKKASTSVMRMV